MTGDTQSGLLPFLYHGEFSCWSADASNYVSSTGQWLLLVECLSYIQERLR